MALGIGKIGAFIGNRVLLPIWNGLQQGIVGSFRGVWNSVTGNVKGVIKAAKDTITNMPKQALDAIKDLDDRILSIPIGPGFTIHDFGKLFTEPSWGAANDALAAITGVNLQQTFDTISSPTAVSQRIKQYTDVIAQQVVTEIQECIERCLQKILGKVPELEWLFFWQNKLAAFIAEIRLKIQRQIQSQIDKLIFDKLKLQQIGELKQKILEGIRKLCPCDGEVSPSQIRRLQNDVTWSILNRDRDLLEIARETSPELAYYAENPNSTGMVSNRIVDQIIADIEAESYRQLLGFSDDTVNTFVRDDGSIVEDDVTVDTLIPGTPINAPIIFEKGPAQDPDIPRWKVDPGAPTFEQWVNDDMPLGDRMWAGGTPWFDQTTGNRRTPREVYNMLYPNLVY